jgi:hypothetical protein
MPIQCCQELADLLANADSGKVFLLANKGYTVKFAYCPFCGLKVGSKQMDDKTMEELKIKHPLVASLLDLFPSRSEHKTSGE